LELVLGDLDGAVVHREWSNIDLLIVVDALKLVCIVENKIDAGEGDGQLERYRALVEARFPSWRQINVFLTPDGRAPDHSSYVAMSYASFADVLEAMIGEDNLKGTEVATIVSHYVDMLRRYIVPDEELQLLARRLYERHQEAFDFIFEARPQPGNLLDATRPWVEELESLALDRNTPSFVRFAPRAWAGIGVLNCCSTAEWTRTGRNLIFEIKAWDTKRVAIFLVSGPADPIVRKHLYERALARPDLFRGLVKPMGAKWATIYMRDLLTAVAAKNMEQDEITAAVRSSWDAFVVDDLPRLTEAVIAISNDVALGG
jgi:hypothetical protein